MNKRAVMMIVVVLAVVALALPIASMRSRAASSGSPKVATPKVATAVSASATTAPQERSADGGNQYTSFAKRSRQAPGSDAGFQPLNPDIVKAMGIGRQAGGQRAAKKQKQDITLEPQSGTPPILNARSALSAALMTTIGGRDNQFSEVTLLADWDGREDCTADREVKVDDFSNAELEIDQTLLRTAISEHTRANGFNENILYYGDSTGNVFVGADTNLDGRADLVTQINLPTVLNAFGTLNGDDQVAITGLGVNPVADLTSFANVNGAFAPFAGQIGEILYVSFWDTEGGLRLANPPTNDTIVRGGVLAFPIADLVSPAAAPPGILSQAGFPVQVGGAFGVAFTVFSTVGGLAVDDDGSVYFHQADLIGLTGANIVKIQSLDTATNQDRSLATSSFLPVITSLNPTNGSYGTSSGPANQINRATNYSGTSTTFGNIVSLAAGSCNTIYAALARSFNSADDQFTQLTEGAFTNPTALGATPSLIISFADCSGASDACSAVPSFGGGLPVADGFADVAQAGLTRTPGVNNFRVFVLGNGPDIRPAAGGTSVVPGTPASVLKVDMQIDYTLHSGITVNEEGTVFVISGGTPAGIGKNPSPMLGEILCFEDGCPMDRRADFVDLRGNAVPNPPASGGNVGDGDSDRFDHIWFQAPLDQVTITPGGLAGLTRGFLRYTNRLAPNPIGPGVTLGRTGGQRTQADDGTDGPIFYDLLDPGNAVAGGDDQNQPFRGDDNDGLGGTPRARGAVGTGLNGGQDFDVAPPNVGPVPQTVAGALSGGFEFIFGAAPIVNSSNSTVGCVENVYNSFFLNSNGSITFTAGDTDNTPTVPEFRAGLPKIAPAWADLDPNARAVNAGTFPVQALGYANVNSFRVRWINVPEFGAEGCVGANAGVSNTFGLTLFDDGTGLDDNHNQAFDPTDATGDNVDPAFDLQEGPTDLRFTLEPVTGNTLIGCPPRREGSGHFIFDYCRMDLLGTADRPVITGYSIGGLAITNPPGLCETNLSTAATRAETGPFGVIDGQVATIQACLIGEGTEPTIYELFNGGSDASIGSGGEVTLATPDFDLRFEGNDPALCTATRQRDLNKGKVGFFGISCPANPLCAAVTPVGTIAVAPNQPAVGSAAAGSQLNSSGARVATPTSGIINAVGNVTVNFFGCFFFPNEVTTICQGFSNETGVPLQRPGKTVTTGLALGCDSNGDGFVDTVIPLTNVVPNNINLVRGTLSAPATVGLPCSAFPLACCGGLANLTLTTTFTTGDNNIFGAFTRTANCTIDLGVRAPVVTSVTASNGNCALPINNLLVSGSCFVLPSFGPAGVGSTNVTSVFALEAGNPNNRVNGFNVVILSPNLLSVDFNFTTANAGKTFLIFVSGPNGTSRNLTTAVNGCLGNELGIQVTFTCNALTAPGGSGTPAGVAVVTGCRIERDDVGTNFLIISGQNFESGAAVTVGSKKPKKVKFQDVAAGSNTFTTLRAKGKFCGGLPGDIVVTNPGKQGSAPFSCNQVCQ